MRKMILEILLVIIIVLVLVYIIFVFAKTVFSPNTPQNSFNFVCINGHCLFVELAKTQSEIERGLMNRKELDKNSGMLFIFEKDGIYPFWMKSTLIPLDIIWVDGQGKIVYINQNTQPCKGLICPQIVPNVRARYVLEVNAGIVSKTGIKAGDFLELKIVN